MTSRRPVVVTGAGAICALGDRPAAIHSALCDGTSGFATPTIIPADASGGAVVAEVPGFNAQSYFASGNVRPLDRTGRLALVAVERTLQSSDWTLQRRAATPLGLILGTMFCSVRTIGEFDRRAQQAGPEYASPLDFSNTVLNAAAGQVAIWEKLRGINTTVSTGAVSSLDAMGYAARMIRGGRADALLAGGAEELCYESFHGARQAGRLAPPDGHAVRPFDSARAGTALGEGAAFFAFEAEAAARARGATIVARVAGCGSAYDPNCKSANPGCGSGAVAAAIERALKDAELAGADVGFVVASAGGSPTLDQREGVGIAAALGAHIPVTTIKSLLGDTLGASGALQAICAIESLRTGRLPGVAGLSRLDPAIAIDATAETRAIQARHALVTAVAPEGNCAAILFSLA